MKTKGRNQKFLSEQTFIPILHESFKTKEN